MGRSDVLYVFLFFFFLLVVVLCGFSLQDEFHSFCVDSASNERSILISVLWAVPDASVSRRLLLCLNKSCSHPLILDIFRVVQIFLSRCANS